MGQKSFFEWLVARFGDILVYRWPMFLLYNPAGYRVRGEDVRALLDCVVPGDILVRGYDHYLDGWVIPGYFSHCGIYLGDLNSGEVEAIVGAHEPKHPVGARPRKMLKSGVVIHALAEGVIIEDLIDFCRCDYMAALRFPDNITGTNLTWSPMLPDDAFDCCELNLLTRLRDRGGVTREQAQQVVRTVALGQLGTRYDFSFDFQNFDRFSCSELVYFVTKALGPFMGVSPINRRMLLIFKHSIVEPDAFVRAPLEVAWKSPSVDDARFATLRSGAVS
jgi:hypothetical protein